MLNNKSIDDIVTDRSGKTTNSKKLQYTESDFVVLMTSGTGVIVVY